MVNWLVETLRGSPELAIFLALGAGYWLGAIEFGSFSLGSVTGGPRGGSRKPGEGV